MASLEGYHTFTNFTNRPADELTRRLREMAPVADAKIFLSSGGSDSVDAAAKLARRFWARDGQPDKQVIVSRRRAYHGLHAFGTSLSGMEPLREGYGGELVTGTALVETNDAQSLADLIKRLGAEKIAAFFCEPVIGTGGIVPPAANYLAEVQELCHMNDILFVVDEVITGFGRLGSMFGSQRFDLEPDMTVFAKGVTSGYPVTSDHDEKRFIRRAIAFRIDLQVGVEASRNPGASWCLYRSGTFKHSRGQQ
jgi:adenosylmethionine-8-amino-7-oxononanoate aminotransferase